MHQCTKYSLLFGENNGDGSIELLKIDVKTVDSIESVFKCSKKLIKKT